LPACWFGLAYLTCACAHLHSFHSSYSLCVLNPNCVSSTSAHRAFSGHCNLALSCEHTTRACMHLRSVYSSYSLCVLNPNCVSCTSAHRAFSGHCNLRHLALSCEHTSDAGLAALSGLSHLADLTLCEGPAISAQRLIGVIQRLPRLAVSGPSNAVAVRARGLWCSAFACMLAWW
jgi:hypothetical protein